MTYRKGFLNAAVLISVLILAAATINGGTVVLSLGDVTAAPGKETRVPVQVGESGDMGPLQFEVHYDSALLAFQSVSAGEAMEGDFVESYEPEPGVVRIALVSGSAIQGNGTVLLLTFTATGKTGDRTSLEIVSPRAWVYGDTMELQVETRPGSVTVRGLPLPDYRILFLAAGALLVLLILLLIIYFARRPGKKAQAPGNAGTGSHFCTQCGSAVQPGARFCGKCGSAVS